MTSILTNLFDGVAYGMLLFVLACGLAVTLGLMNFVNLAHGAFAMAGGYVCMLLVNKSGWPFFAALPLVAEGRIDVRPWMTDVIGQTVRFGDGHTGEFDAILFGTGFDLHLPFLAQDIREILDLDAHPPDGVVACLGGDPETSVLSLSGASGWTLPPAAAARVVDRRIPPGSEDAAYLAAVDALVAELRPSGLVLYLAGGDPLAGDPLGALAVSEAAVNAPLAAVSSVTVTVMSVSPGSASVMVTALNGVRVALSFTACPAAVPPTSGGLLVTTSTWTVAVEVTAMECRNEERCE